MRARLAPREHATFAALWDPAEFYCPAVEAIAAESARETHGHFNVIHSESAMRADHYFQLGGSDRHLRDVARMPEISRDEVDQSTLD